MSDLVPYHPNYPEQIVIEGELVDGTCEFPSCGLPGDLVIDPYQAEIYDEQVYVVLCPGHLQDRHDDI
jgi:hypothetical protein